MNWEAFVATLTYCVTVLGVLSVVLGVTFLPEVETNSRQPLLCVITGVVVAVLGFSTISGMGWWY